MDKKRKMGAKTARRPTSTGASILSYLEKVGEATAAEIAENIGASVKVVSSLAGRYTKKRDLTPQLLRVVRFDTDHGSARAYPRAVYALGSGKNATYTRPTRAELSLRYYHERKMRTVSSVFDLGVPVAQRSRGSRASINPGTDSA